MSAGKLATLGRVRSAVDSRVLAFDQESRRAEEALRGQLEGAEQAWHFVEPQPFGNGNFRLSLRAAPEPSAPQTTEALPGEALEWLWDAGDWAMIRTMHDRYLGWVRRAELDLGLRSARPDLTVTALRAHAFAEPSVSSLMLAELSLGVPLTRRAAVAVEEHHRCWLPVQLPDGAHAWVHEECFGPLAGSRAALALRFLETPYVWGGRSAWGLDCSGLTQVVYTAFGQPLPRDADQQRQFLRLVDTPAAGDLAFFPGHVGVMLDKKTVVHANATHMRVTVETLGEGKYGQRLADSCTGFGRLP